MEISLGKMFTDLVLMEKIFPDVTDSMTLEELKAWLWGILNTDVNFEETNDTSPSTE